MSIIRQRNSIESECSSGQLSPNSSNWGIGERAESINAFSEDGQFVKADNLSQIMSWFEANNIKPGNPNSISESYESKQKQIVLASSIKSVCLSSSSLLARRSKLSSAY